MLTSTEVKSAKPRVKAYKLFDGRGLYLQVMPTGSRRWRFKYRFNGREKLLSVGLYPDVSLKLARERREELRAKLANNIDPSAERKAEKCSSSDTFQGVAVEWFTSGCPGGRNGDLSPKTINLHRRRFEKHLAPRLGALPISSITISDLREALLKIQGRGTLETAHRVRSLAERIFRYAIATGRAERNIAADLRGTLTASVSQHYASITDPSAVGGLLRAIDTYDGHPSVFYALKLAPYLFVRPGELRGAVWDEFDFESSMWVIPASRMKMKKSHTVPLAKQAKDLLTELRQINGDSKLIFPGLRSKKRPISDNSMNAALRRLGYSKESMTAHGFRTTASTNLHEMGFDTAVIELQLAHLDKNKIRAAYNRAERLPDRKDMMRKWANWLDEQRSKKSF